MDQDLSSPDGGAPKILPTPIKSPNDDKEYRNIQLENGVKVALISYNPCAELQQKIDRDRRCMDKAIAKFNFEVVGVKLCDSEKETRPSSSTTAANRKKRNYGKSGAASMAKPIERCDSNDYMTGICLSVGTGWLDEPRELPGSAHFLEHLLMVGGSQKYPRLNILQLLAENDADFNASTSASQVQYYFGIRHKNLFKVLEQFVNIFISPTLNLYDIKTEREAVDSEFQDKQYNDICRMNRMYQLFMKDDHPAGHFHTGSKETLVAPDGDDQTLREMLQAYFETSYGAENITVGIQAPLSLDEIQNIANKYFGQIPKRIAKIERQVQEEEWAMNPLKFRRFYTVKSEMNWDLLWVAWDLPISVIRNYATKPLKYLASLIGTDGPGGLANFLKESKFISEMVCLIPTKEFYEYSSALFKIVFVLEKTDMETISRILESLCSYLKFLLIVGPQKFHFNEQQCIESLHFHFPDGRHPLENTSTDLAGNLRWYSPEDSLIGDHLITKWDPCAITNCLETLTPCTANIILLSSSVDNCEHEEHFFKLKYNVMEDAEYQSWVKRLSNGQQVSKFKFPAPNKFIPNNFCGTQSVCKDDPGCANQLNTRVRVMKNRRLQFFNLKLKSEFAWVTIRVTTAVPFDTTHNKILGNIWVRLLRNRLRPFLYGAREALYQYNIQQTYTGIFIYLSGFNQHIQPVALEIVKQFENLLRSTTPKMFDAEKLQILGNIDRSASALMDPGLLSMITFFALCLENVSLPWPEVYKTLERITFGDFVEFAQDFKEKLFISVGGYGDVDKDNSLEFANKITRTVTYEPLPRCSFLEYTSPIKIGSKEFSNGYEILLRKSLSVRCNQAAIKCIYQVHSQSEMDWWICRYLEYFMFWPAHCELRRKQDLGEVTGVFLMFGPSGEVYLEVYVNSYSNKFSAAYVQQKIDNFVKEYYLNILMKIKPAKFYKTFSVTLKEVLEFYEKYLLSGPKSEMRSASVQVIGHSDRQYTQEIGQDLSVIGRGNRMLKDINENQFAADSGSYQFQSATYSKSNGVQA